MIVPTFTFDADLNGYVCEPLIIQKSFIVEITLDRKAPVVTLKLEKDGEYANYGQTPSVSDRYRLRLSVAHPTTIRIATPVRVAKCMIIN